MTLDDRPTERTRKALALSCPKCSAPPGSPCVQYTPSQNWDRTLTTDKARALAEHEGQPNQKPHNERYNKVPNERRLAQVAAQKRALRTGRERRDAYLRTKEEAIRVQWQQERAFHRWQMLSIFFQQHGDIFQEGQ